MIATFGTGLPKFVIFKGRKNVIFAFEKVLISLIIVQNNIILMFHFVFFSVTKKQNITVIKSIQR